MRKILRAIPEKTALPTNQPTSYYQQHQFYRTWLTPVQKKHTKTKLNMFELQRIIIFYKVKKLAILFTIK